MIMKCDCINKMQDELHGPGMRVHNKMVTPKTGKQEYRCTVCQSVKAGKSNEE